MDGAPHYPGGMGSMPVYDRQIEWFMPAVPPAVRKKSAVPLSAMCAYALQEALEINDIVHEPETEDLP